jgi:hypothetical protein
MNIFGVYIHIAQMAIVSLAIKLERLKETGMIIKKKIKRKRGSWSLTTTGQENGELLYKS